MVRRLPNLNAVKAFDAAARHGSFVRAAEELSVTHSAISRHVRALEEELGVSLFERRHRQVVLTSVGARYAKAVESALLSISLDTGNLRKPDRRTRLVIDVDSDLNALWLLPQIQPSWFAEADIELDIRSHPEPPRSISHEADLAITWGPVEMPGFEREAFLDFTCFPVCSPDLAAGLDLRDIASVPLLHDRTSNWWDEALGRWGISLNTAGSHLFFHRTYLCMEAAARGMGLAIGDEVSSAEMLQSGRLISPCGPVLPGRVSYYLLYPRTRPLPASIRILLEWLRARRDAHNEWAQWWRSAHFS